MVKSCNYEDFEGSDRNDQLLPLSTTTTFSNNESYEILEGLTSNIFIVYGGKIIKTPPITSTLEGYGRKLVIDCAVKCGYQVEIEPIRSHDSSLWKEVFFTSSIRLLSWMKIKMATMGFIYKQSYIFPSGYIRYGIHSRGKTVIGRIDQE